MRFVQRFDLPVEVNRKLKEMQSGVDANRSNSFAYPEFDAIKKWKGTRKSSAISIVEGTLKKMMRECERCMYCLDSHGTDIEHFWPKTPYPEQMYIWENLLLCCTECGRFKGEKFPLDLSGIPLLIDPTAEDPWKSLDFDPETGNIMARFLPAENNWSARGVKTVEVLHLDRREAMAAGYKRTLRRLKYKVQAALEDVNPDVDALFQQLKEEDDHGLLQWCFLYSDRDLEPFRTFRERWPEKWHVMEDLVQRMYG